eukprot:1772835-Rhodomonas_salina.1
MRSQGKRPSMPPPNQFCPNTGKKTKLKVQYRILQLDIRPNQAITKHPDGEQGGRVSDTTNPKRKEDLQKGNSKPKEHTECEQNAVCDAPRAQGTMP